MTPQQKLNVSKSEFYNEFLENYGNNLASKIEASDRIEWCETIGRDVAALFIKNSLDIAKVDFVLDAITEIEPDEAYLVACAVAVAIEEAK